MTEGFGHAVFAGQYGGEHGILLDAGTRPQLWIIGTEATSWVSSAPTYLAEDQDPDEIDLDDAEVFVEIKTRDFLAVLGLPVPEDLAGGIRGPCPQARRDPLRGVTRPVPVNRLRPDAAALFIRTASTRA